MGWPIRTTKEKREVIFTCKTHGELVFEGQVYRSKKNGKIYYQCKSCHSCRKAISEDYINYMSKTN